MRHCVWGLGVASLLWLGLAARGAAQQVPATLTSSPHFGLAIGIARVSWANDAVASATGPSLSFEGRLVGPTAVSAGVATVSAAEGSEDARHYFVEVALRLAPQLRPGGIYLTPYLGAGIGTTITDPAADSLVTRSQNTWEWMAGVDAAIAGPLTVGIQFRHLQVQLQDLLVSPPAVSATPTGVTWLEGHLGLRF
jgi:hypothetical protein